MTAALREFAAATNDYERLLDVVARTLSEVVKDGCVVRLLSEGGWLSPVASYLPFESQVADSQVVALIKAHIAKPHNISEQTSARQVIETGEPYWVQRLDLEHMRPSASPEIMHAFEQIGIHSLLMVALRVRGESIGLLSLVRFKGDSPPFTEQDRDVAQALADHAALAISNARLLKSVIRELAERKRAEAALLKTEERLRHSQKMEAVGRFAGGVAHDFNNILSIILSYSELIEAELGDDEPLRGDVEQIQQAGLRAADLTRQLLAFSRQQVIESKIINVNQSLQGIEKMLRRLLGADVELTLLSTNELWTIRSDTGQVEQIVMNLAVNARDAMPEGGSLTIETRNEILDEEFAQAHPEVMPGEYVMLAVSDSGMGMNKRTQSRIFDPFFTTKAMGKGTGLGLATVYGIVKQGGGHIWVFSEPGRGTLMKLYFPRVEGIVKAQESERPSPDLIRGTGTILLVEDDEQVRNLAQRILRDSGYIVLEAHNGGEAFLICEQHEARIDLLLTDVVLPRMNGRQLAVRVVAQRPDLKVLFMSGYTDGAAMQHGTLDVDSAYLQKPLTPSALTRKVREVLQSPPRSAARN